MKKWYAKMKCKTCEGSCSVRDFHCGEMKSFHCSDCGAEGVVERDLSTLTVDEVKEWNKVVASKSFQELNEDDKNFLTQLSWNRAVKEGRELLWDVVCAWRPKEVPGQMKAELELKERNRLL